MGEAVTNAKRVFGSDAEQETARRLRLEEQTDLRLGQRRAQREPLSQSLLEMLPADHLMYGSDFPHPEGMGDPLGYSEVVENLPMETQALIMGGSLGKIMKVS